MNRHERRLWRDTHDLDDLCTMTIRWLDGEVQETPGHGGPPCEETAEIADDLRAFNRAGFLTTGSQPGADPERGWDGRLWHQRAYVEGYTTPGRAAEIKAACLAAWVRGGFESGLEYLPQPVSEMPGRLAGLLRPSVGRTPVTARVRGRAATECPHLLARPDHDVQFDGVGSGAWAAVEQAVRVTVVDTRWGASRELWDTLREALGAVA